ncbi:MAG: DUF4912 domain-containing protein [Treponemataceae bacterium]
MGVIMEKLALTRSYLETLSSVDLIDLASDYGVDIPEGLNRRFIISELLDVIDFETTDALKNTEDDAQKNDDVQINQADRKYFATKIVAVLRNPSWLFVFWTINKHDIEKDFSKKHTLSLHLGYYFTKDAMQPDEVHSIPTNFDQKDLNIFISKKCYAICVSLVLENKEHVVQTIAHSNKVIIAQVSPEVSALKLPLDAPPITLLSGIDHLWHSHYFIHNQTNA